MPFVKLDCGILDSTLWMNRDDRDVFLTALLMGTPCTLRDEMEQLEINGLNPTGFVVPPGKYGFVEASGPGIVKRADIPDMSAGLAAIERLGMPDRNSRTADFEGRRLVRVDGGFIVLNFWKYRERDYTGAERQKRYRDKHNGVTHKGDAVISRQVTYAEAEAEADTEQEERHGPQSGPGAGHDAAEQVIQLVKAIYPKREGHQRWPQATKHVRAALKAGTTAQELVDGVTRYAAYCESKEITGSDKVLQAASFFGEVKGWRETWEVQAKAKPRQWPAIGDEAGWKRLGKQFGIEPAVGEALSIFQGRVRDAVNRGGKS